ncbi:MAG: hypothetical protein COB02_05910 [Candidatus Cloacimonadota bacterium]|nr:MAG: hypothetical protein COB02_12180 [Candidatus Cloacimonadota bacterium]PCJ20133.1 MAG: hypothetical protein COB02_05910 [Candidatus Cloacimonadota bacterium]
MSKEEIIIGIDLGTTNTLVACYEGQIPCVIQENESRMIPSIVTYTGDEIFVGDKAKQNFSKYPETTFFSAKRFFGKTFAELEENLKKMPFKVTGDDKSLKFVTPNKNLSPFEISIEVLKEAKNRAQRVLNDNTIKKAVITVPAYFDDGQRNETKTAAMAAGLEVLRIINEPTAAALAYGLDFKKEGKIAVYDLGGGTFDISILDLKDGVFRVLSTNGDTFLGGDDFDTAIVDYLLEGVDEKRPEVLIALKYAAEEIKIRLSEKDSVPVKIDLLDEDFYIDKIITRDLFESLIQKKVKQTIRASKKALKDAQLEVGDISEVVLVGGSSRIPLVRSMVGEFFDKQPFIGLNPDEVVALGAATQARIISGKERDLLLLDVIPLSIGLETLGGAVTKVLLRNTTIPASVTEEFTTSVDDQTGINLNVYQGERELIEDCRPLGKFKLSVPPMKAGYPRVKVTFHIDENGMLKVDAFEERSGQKAQIEINPVIGLSHAEMNNVIKASIDCAMDDFQLRMIVELRNKAERIIVATERTYDKAYRLMEKSDVDEIKVWVKKAKDALKRHEKDQAILEKVVNTLGDLTLPLADLLFSDATKQALVGKETTAI